MAREIDARRAGDRADDSRRRRLRDAAEAVSDRVLPGAHRVRVASMDAATGNAAVVTSHNAEAAPGDYVARAIQHLQRIGPALGLAENQAAEFVADPQDQATSSGAVAVHLRQHYKGIPIYDAAQTVRFGAEGSIAEVAGRSVTVAEDIPLTTAVSAEDGLRIAAAHVAEPGDADTAERDPFGEPLVDPGLDLTGFAPVPRTTGPDRTDRPATFDAPPFEHVVTIALVWFPVDGGLRLGWQTKLALPDGPVFRVIVDGNDGRILLATRLTRGIAGRASVVLEAGAAARTLTMPRSLTSYGAPVPGDLPPGFPDDWLRDPSTIGASVHAVVEPGGVPATGSVQDGTVVFAPGPGTPEHLAVNLFALCSSMHDLLYLLGFRETDGNFQGDNRGRGGRELDPLAARVHPGPVWGTANMGTPPDGSRPTMNMGLVTSTNRHTALDPDVVFHEYTHGLTNRLVGGSLNDAALEALQSRGMGEGWSDFFACVALDKEVVGDWVVNRPTGIRRFRYDDAFPDTYANLGAGRYVGDAVHNIGELWCAGLMALARRIGSWTAAQLVVDGLKLTVANPSFLAARDAILLAANDLAAARGDNDTERADFVHAVWEVFAAHGMGPGARTNGPENLTGIVADFSTPPRPEPTSSVTGSATPALAIPDRDPAGVTSAIDLPDSGLLLSLTVAVDITHPYIGDLQVSLVSPGGLAVPLHARAGGSADNLHTSWESGSHTGLEALLGLPAGGRWTLFVADLASRDVGTLDSWSIQAEVESLATVVEGEAVPGLLIPDNQASGARSDLVLDTAGTISDLRLDLDITHTYVGDLEVTLTGPAGTRVTLRAREGGSADNLIATYTSEESGILAPFIGTKAGGTWSLLVVDRAGQDVGKLNHWRLKATV